MAWATRNALTMAKSTAKRVGEELNCPPLSRFLAVREGRAHERARVETSSDVTPTRRVPSKPERELIAAYVSGLNRCRYCHGVHTATAERLGVPAGAVQQLLEGIDATLVADKMRPILRYAQKLTRQPDGVTKVDADAIFAAGSDETALYHAVAVTALFNFMNRLVEGLGIELEPAYVKPASERLAERGYRPLIDMLKR
jgi:uncharacterized peroxidase-related enzyme